ncbi:Reverse transcriptase from mobile element jockey protein [Ceratobasidium theobromae]|uniref:Reverse transcriptase from mobile element jockey protein n=1 Tax=Ceratobasidium theobromae TaxID=1582974 RepID=A0A5N5QDQ4_9AGAM|nr:Reverse transcriptase from mobile element jockey protein [Ceratobasidium theobromae]
MSAIANSQPPAPPVEIPPDDGGAKNEVNTNSPAAAVAAPGGPERVISSFPLRLVPYKLGASPGLRRSSRIADRGRALPAPSPDLRNASDQFLEETFKGFMKLNKEVKEKKHKKGLKVEAQGSPLIPVPRSYNVSRDPSPSPLQRGNTIFDHKNLHAHSIDITNAIPPADQEVSIAPADPATFTMAAPMALPRTERPTPALQSPIPVRSDDPEFTKVVESMLEIATKDILDRLTAPTVLDPPGDEKLALPQLLEGPWSRLRTTMQRRAACPYAKSRESSLAAAELKLWGEVRTQISGGERPGRRRRTYTPDFLLLGSGQCHFLHAGGSLRHLGEIYLMGQALKRAHDFGAAQKDDATPPDNNALGLFVQPTAAPPPLVNLTAATHTSGTHVAPKQTVIPAPPCQPPAKTWANVAASTTAMPALVRGGNMPVRNTTMIQKELGQIKAQKMVSTDENTPKPDKEGWNVKGKGRKNKATPAANASLPAGVLPVRKADLGKNKQSPDLEVAFKPTSPIDVDLVKARANQNESHSCLMWLLKHCNELTASKEYKDKTDIRVKSFTYSRNGNCIAVFTLKTDIKEVELFAPGLCGVMGLKGDVMVQRTSGWTRMRVSHFPAWATDPDTGEWLERINSKEEILSQPTPAPTFPLGTATPSSPHTQPAPESRNAKGAAPTSARDRRHAAPQCGAINACRAQKVADKPGHVCSCAPRCANCKGAHFFGDPLCPGRLKFEPAPPAIITDEYTAGMKPPGGSPGSAVSMRTPPTGMITLRVQFDDDEAMAPPPALADNGLISREIMQVNAVKSNTHIHALLASPEYHDISILIVSDLWWGPIGTTKHDTNDQHKLLGAPANPLWRCFAPPIDTQNPASPPSCIVYVQKDRGILAEIDLLSPATPFFFTLDIFINGFGFKIIPVYLHDPKHVEAAQALFQLPMIETPTLVCGDFNIQHPDFSDFPGAKVKSSALGREFAEWLLDSDLHVLNDLHRPTREPRVQGHAPSIIDFTIVNGALFSMDIVSDWDSSFAHSLDSDHTAIFFTIHAPRISDHPTKQYHFVIDPLMEEDWTAAFEHRVLELGLRCTVTCPQEVEELASGLLSACTWATEAVMECRLTQRKAPWAPWWNEDCSAACRRVVMAKEEGLDRDEIRSCTSHLWYCIWKAKRSFFDDICSTARPDNIWGINQCTFFPYTPVTLTGLSVESATQNAKLPFPTISRGEIAANLAGCSNKSAPGAHGSNYRVLRWAFAARGDLIEVLYNAMLSFEYHPVCFKNALIAPIPKPNKFDFASPKAGKDMTSCMDAGLSLVHDIESAWAAKKQASITLLDISGYFNNINHDLLAKCMQKMGYPPQVLGWLRSYLSDRTVSFRINDKVGAAFELQGRGIPQGSPLSPVFSSIFTAPMLATLRARGVQVRAYIDDLCIFKQDDSQEGCIARLLEGTRATLEALLDMGLSAERSKTELIHFAKNAREMTKNLPLVLGDKAEDIVRGGSTNGHQSQMRLGGNENVGE